jgi:hypothetical protein
MGVVASRAGRSPTMDPPPQPSPTRGEGAGGVLAAMRGLKLIMLLNQVREVPGAVGGTYAADARASRKSASLIRRSWPVLPASARYCRVSR